MSLVRSNPKKNNNTRDCTTPPIIQKGQGY